MRLTRSEHSKAARPVFDDGFDELREAFRARLGSERIHFIALSTALARAIGTPIQILNELRNRAHRLSGTAAIFELIEIAAAARTLELSVVSASTAQAHDPGGAAVCAALDALVRLIANLGQEVPSMRPSAAQRPLLPPKAVLHS
jgi:HPt (histidine-containing phosphotransfer) domain-containing protein